jgi:hypothetical protein
MIGHGPTKFHGHTKPLSHFKQWNGGCWHLSRRDSGPREEILDIGILHRLVAVEKRHRIPLDCTSTRTQQPRVTAHHHCDAAMMLSQRADRAIEREHLVWTRDAAVHHKYGPAAALQRHAR